MNAQPSTQSTPDSPKDLDAAEVRAMVEKAFDYRGDVTIRLKDGRVMEGFLFDRQAGPDLAGSWLRLIPKNLDEKIAVKYADVAGLALTGRDAAEGKSFETWVRKYREKRAAGETNIRLEPERLD